ncbi:SlyX family protein [Sneathiella chinensis]|uniref:Protein SlyX homolog n=1 Tax=Sneathiella chinensis TaxID=349750 RepID=A0ABQ5U7A6_9PROT|nr:SlyX family protein [Sneathiella chinensis]GLQ07149.1 hypothetical protein GCM10007924_23700 [Sneathiella chinensis]
MTDDLEKRLTTLELTVMHQEQALTDLSDMVTRQWSEIERLQAKLTTTQQRVVSLEENLPVPAADQKPPHY